MVTILVTGATGFLGYHVVKWLNAAGVRPRVLEPREARIEALGKLDVQRCPGYLDDPAAMRAACSGADTLMHLAFKVSIGGGPQLVDDMYRVNIHGTRNLLDAAALTGVKRVLVAGSALAVGVNRKAEPLDENAAWSQHAFDLPYVNIRRQAELNALARATSQFEVVSVCPSLTLGPDDPAGAPGNNVIQALITGRLKFTLPAGFGCLDVRDFAQAAVLAAERGRSGQRYLVSGDNVTTEQLLDEAAAIAGVRAPRFTPPLAAVHGYVAALELTARMRGRPVRVTRGALQIVGRYAWYDTSKARAELGWSPRPLRETLDDTIAWLRNPSVSTEALYM